MVTLHEIILLAAVAAVSSVKLFPEIVTAPPAPMPVQVTLAIPVPAGGVSVMVVGVPGALKVCIVPVTGMPEDVVVMVWLAQPLVPVNVFAPTGPILVLLSRNCVIAVLVNIQLKSAPTFTLAAGMVNVVPERVPKVPMFPFSTLFASIQLADVNT